MNFVYEPDQSYIENLQAWLTPYYYDNITNIYLTAWIENSSASLRNKLEYKFTSINVGTESHSCTDADSNKYYISCPRIGSIGHYNVKYNLYGVKR